MKTRNSDPSHVQSLDRALRLLELVATDSNGTTLAQLVQGSGLSSSTAHRLLTTMNALHFVQFDSRFNTWSIGRKAFQVGMSFSHRQNLVVPALPIMKRLRDETNDTVNLGMRTEDEIVLLAQVESRHVVRAVGTIGSLTPVVNCALGKAILATLTEEDVRQIADRLGMQAYTPHSILRLPTLLRDLKTAREAGYAKDDGEFVNDVRCAAAAIFDMQGEAVASLSISALTGRVDETRFQELGTAVRGAATQLTQAIGGTFPARAALPNNDPEQKA